MHSSNLHKTIDLVEFKNVCIELWTRDTWNPKIAKNTQHSTAEEIGNVQNQTLYLVFSGRHIYFWDPRFDKKSEKSRNSKMVQWWLVEGGGAGFNLKSGIF